MRNASMPIISNTLALTASLAIGLSIGLYSSSLPAQIYNDSQENSQSFDNVVVIYKDCGYQGESRVVSTGNHSKMSEISFENDSVSSIRVPQGLEVTIYEDDRFEGTYARINQDISCFDKQWNDKVSSLKVSVKRDFYGRRNNHRDGSTSDPNNRQNSDYSSRDNGNTNNTSANNVSAKNVTRVVFEDRVLQQVNKEQWKIADARYGVSQYRETSRDSSSVYLQNDYTEERIRIDLFANDVTFVDGDGRTQRYAIQGKQSTLRQAPANLNARSDNDKESYRVGDKGCFRYKVYTGGGEGGLRFHGKDGFHRFYKKGRTDRICHDGELTMEIGKTDLATDVFVEIQGQRIRFAPNEKPSSFKNTWYRKLVRLTVR